MALSNNQSSRLLLVFDLGGDSGQLPDAVFHSVHGRNFLSLDLRDFHLRSDQVTCRHFSKSGRQDAP